MTHLNEKARIKVQRIKDWAYANYSKSYGASALVECYTDAELDAEFSSLKDAKWFAGLMSDRYADAQY